MMQDEKELYEDFKETKCLCPVVRKWLMSVVKKVVSILEEVLEILIDFKELIAGELTNNFPPMRDKCQMNNVVDKCSLVKIFNVADIYLYQADGRSLSE